MPSLGKTLCAALVLASSLVGSLADDSQHQLHVRSPKHSRRAAAHQERDLDAGPSSQTLSKRGPTYSGRASFYAAGLGACGGYNSGSDFIVALNAAQYGNLGQRSSWCGKTIAITYNGNTQYATVVDACPGCPYGALDMSEGLFRAFANPDVGIFQMTWTAADGSDNNHQASSSSSRTPRPTPTSTWQQPTWTWTPPTTTSSAQRVATTSSASSSSSSQISSSTQASSTSSSQSASQTSSDQATATPEAANNLDSFALIYQGLNQMAVAAAS